MKGQNDESADLKWSMWSELQSSLDNGRYHECLLQYSQQISVLVKKGDETCHLWRNKSSEFLTLCQCLHVLEKKSGRGDNLSREHNFLLESENPSMKIFKLLSIPEGKGGEIRFNIAIHSSKMSGT